MPFTHFDIAKIYAKNNAVVSGSGEILLP
jgi:hypothetical protein